MQSDNKELYNAFYLKMQPDYYHFNGSRSRTGWKKHLSGCPDVTQLLSYWCSKVAHIGKWNHQSVERGGLKAFGF